MSPTLQHLIEATEAQPAAAAPRSLLDEIISATEAQPVAPSSMAISLKRKLGMVGPGWWEESNAAPRATMQVFTDPRTGVRYPTRADYIKATQPRPVCPVCGRPDCPGATDPTYR